MNAPTNERVLWGSQSNDSIAMLRGLDALWARIHQFVARDLFHIII